MSAEERQRVVEVAQSWLRTPYHHRGAVKGAGTDCGMVLIKVFSEAGLIDDFDPGEYPADWMLHQDGERYLGIVERFAKRVRQCGPGDVVLFKFGRCISHGAIVVNWPTIIHAYHGHGVILDDVAQNHRLRDRLVGFWSVWDEATA